MWSVRSLGRRAVTGLPAIALLVVAGGPVAWAQGAAGGGFAPGGRTILALDFAGTPVGQFPRGLRLVRGNLEVVDKDGMHMLRASSPSDFVVKLPEVLPTNFALEFDLIPKACCNPVDLMVEGVTSGSRSMISAQIEWDAEHFAVVGGNPLMFQMDMPAAIAGTLPSTRTKVTLSFKDRTITMYTNGVPVYTLTERKFVRDTLLHISLGGQDDDKYAVYLASVRVADLASPVVVSAAPQAGPRSVSVMPAQPNVAPPPGGSGTAISSRTIPLTGFTAVGTAGTIQSRTITLAGFSASATAGSVASRTIALTGFTANGATGSAAVASRTIALTGFTSAGTAAVVASRTIQLAGWSAVGIP